MLAPEGAAPAIKACDSANGCAGEEGLAARAHLLDEIEVLANGLDGDYFGAALACGALVIRNLHSPGSRSAAGRGVLILGCRAEGR